MSAEYVRRTYRVPAKRGGRVIFDGCAGTIISFPGQYLRLRMDKPYQSMSEINVHPTWNIEYVAVNWPVRT